MVVSAPMPTMPVCLWNDPDLSRYSETYFDCYPGVWRHGDWVTHTDRGSVVIHGRSDTTLNCKSVRLGSADIYEIVEGVPGGASRSSWASTFRTPNTDDVFAVPSTPHTRTGKKLEIPVKRVLVGTPPR